MDKEGCRRPLNLLRSFRNKVGEEIVRRKREHGQEKERRQTIRGVRERIIRLNKRLKEEHGGVLELSLLDSDWERSGLTEEARALFESELEQPEGITSFKVLPLLEEPNNTSRGIKIRLDRRERWFVTASVSAFTHAGGDISVSFNCQSPGGQAKRGFEAVGVSRSKFHGGQDESEHFAHRFEAAAGILDFIEFQLGPEEEQI